MYTIQVNASFTKQQADNFFITFTAVTDTTENNPV